MNLEKMSLATQIDMVFRKLKDELVHLSSGIVFVQIRDNGIGKFGVKHFPLESKEGKLQDIEVGLNETHLKTFRQMALDSLQHKKNWTHGEIYFEFALKQSRLLASVQFESNYNMNNLSPLNPW